MANSFIKVTLTTFKNLEKSSFIPVLLNKIIAKNKKAKDLRSQYVSYGLPTTCNIAPDHDALLILLLRITFYWSKARGST